MNTYLLQEQLMYATYFAPRGRQRLYNLGHQLAQRHLNASDLVIGFIGGPGAGKSRLISGMFPGLELTNDDEGVNIRPLPLLDALESGFFRKLVYAKISHGKEFAIGVIIFLAAILTIGISTLLIFNSKKEKEENIVTPD